MTRLTKTTVALLAAGTFTLGSLGVLAAQQGRTGMWGHDMGSPMTERYNYRNVAMSDYNWSDRWRGQYSDRDMMREDRMMDEDCRHEMRWHDDRSRGGITLPSVGQNPPSEGAASRTNINGADQRQFGRSLVADIGCQGCHQIGADGGRFGPPLNGVVGRQGETFVRSKLENPRLDNSYSRMPDFDLSSEEINAIVAYLATLDKARMENG